MKILKIGALTCLLFGCISYQPLRKNYTSLNTYTQYSIYSIPITLISADPYKNGASVVGTGVPFRKGEGCVWLLTAAHVVEGCEKVTVQVFVGGESVAEEVEGFVVASDAFLDVAVVKIEGSFPYEVARLREKEPQFLQEVIAAGCSLGGAPLYTVGLVSRKHSGSSWVCTAPVISGNSGGPVLDRRTGEVVGLTTAVFMYAAASPFTPAILYYPGNIFVPSNIILEWLKKGV